MFHVHELRIRLQPSVKARTPLRHMCMSRQPRGLGEFRLGLPNLGGRGTLSSGGIQLAFGLGPSFLGHPGFIPWLATLFLGLNGLGLAADGLELDGENPARSFRGLSGIPRFVSPRV